MDDHKYTDEELEQLEELNAIYPGADFQRVAESLAKSLAPTVEKMKEASRSLSKIMLAQDSPDPSRRRFEAVATKRRGRCKRK